MSERIIAAVPAYNEEKTILAVLKPLLEAKRLGIVEDVIVLDDGSTDATAKISKDGNATVISHTQNRGKSTAVMTAVKHCSDRGADIVFFCDADMTNLTADKVQRFLSRIDGRQDINMIRAPYVQIDPDADFFSPVGKNPTLGMCQPVFSGFRAIRMRAISPLLNGSPKWMDYFNNGNLQVDFALETLVPPGGTILKTPHPIREGREICDNLAAGLRAVGDNITADRFEGAEAVAAGKEWRFIKGKELVGGIKVEGGKLTIRVDVDPAAILPQMRTYPARINGGELEIYGAAIQIVDDLGLMSRRRGGGMVAGEKIEEEMDGVRARTKERNRQAHEKKTNRTTRLPAEEIETIAKNTPQPPKTMTKTRN